MANVQQGYGHSDLCAEPFDYYVPLTGAQIVMQSAKLAVNPAGTIATLGVTLPLNPPDGCVAEISSTTAVTTLTVTANTGDLIAGTAATSIAALTGAPTGGSRVVYRYSLFGAIPVSSVTGLGANPRTWIRVN